MSRQVSVEIQEMREAFARLARLDRVRVVDGPTSTARRLASVDVQQMAIRQALQLRVTQADVDAGRASAGDVGKFWFLPGYSLVGGPDVVRP